MTALLVYLLKVNGALLLFAGLYYVGLRRLTFYGLNRAYLLFALLFSALYPVLDVAAIVAPQQQVSGSLLTILPNWSGTVAASAVPQLSLVGALVAAYWTGVVVMSLRLLGRLFSLYRLHRASVPDRVGEVAVRRLPEVGSPFSFGAIIYLTPAQYPAAELPAILHHEQVHVRQWHTLDVLLAHVGQVFCWFNPAAWWLGRAIQENLEFLTDDVVLRAGVVLPKVYQYSLLRLSGLAPGAALANHFTFLTLKNRIAMMNKPSSARAHLAQYALVLPLAAVLLLAFTTSRAGQSASANPASVQVGGVKYYLDGRSTVQSVVEKPNTTPDAIANVQVLKGETAQALTKDAATGVVAVTTKGNERLPAVQALNAKIIRLLPDADTKPEEKVVSISNLHPDALAYITQHFPGHRLVELLEVKESGATEVRYKAVIAMGRRPKYVVFDTQGKALGSFDASGKPLAE
ncbi:peptidase M56 BlaR1 [Hymenobacter roseosalivarius DSM 11622]|uniref:Peptidase M56 BlaR1 n=1 Tax=Hymenobacter roseosalivarius DSM 11622 TaxID=645990 RepID=A0A1W1UT83_9BACT|nr:M56 family metallopeptidase [Hymenobacter roseosalivarius]SMB84250.1 peptidase M56 BlaR1 [Hymenobacter roseosalivarius DSM 11622]